MGGGILTLRVGSKERAYQLMNHLKYALNATNIGDARTLVIHPASTIYIHNTEEQMRDAGVYADTIPEKNAAPPGFTEAINAAVTAPAINAA